MLHHGGSVVSSALFQQEGECPPTVAQDSQPHVVTQTRLRVLSVIPGNGQGTPFQIVRRQVASLANLGVTESSIFFHSRLSPIGILKQIFAIRRCVRRFRPHVIHAHFGTITSIVCAVSARTPLVITFRGSDLHNDPDQNRLRTLLGQLFSQLSTLRARRIVCVSRNLRDRLWWRRDRVDIIPDGTDLELFQWQPKAGARAKLNWSEHDRIVLFSGKRQPRLKGLHFVQESVKVAESIVGPIRLEMLDVPRELMPVCMAAADCLLVASAYEGSPNIVRESLACNLPVLSTPVGDVADRLQNVHPSRVARKDCVEFGSALAEILQDIRPSNGREKGGLWSESDVAEALVSVYRSAVGAKLPAIR